MRARARRLVCRAGRCSRSACGLARWRAVRAADRRLAARRRRSSRRCLRWRRRGARRDGDAPRSIRGRRRAKRRVALLTGCAQTVLDAADQRGDDPPPDAPWRRGRASPGAGCCGALLHHLGARTQAHALCARNIEAWTREIDDEAASTRSSSTPRAAAPRQGLRLHVRATTRPSRQGGAQVAALARDVSESGRARSRRRGAAPARVAYHAACSLQHGQKIASRRRRCSSRAGFTVRDPPEGHICCGSAGTYNILQPELADRAARPQGRQYRKARARRDRRRQYRLHHPDRRRRRISGRPYGRAARLGDRRAAPEGLR